MKQENIIYKLMIKMCSGENPSDFLKFLPIEILEILENNLNLTIDQIKLQKILKDVNFSTTNDSFRPYFMDILEQKINNYTKQIESKRRIPCDLLKELEKNSIFRDITNKNPKNEKILIRGLSSNENSEENLLSNVSHLYEEKFDIEHIID